VANDLKAVVQISANTDGLIKGVDGALQKIDAMSKNTATMAGIMSAEKLIGLAKQMWSAVNERSEYFGKLAQTYSPEAMQATAQAAVAQMKADQRVGVAMGPAEAGIQNMKAENAARQADRIVNNADAIGGGRIQLAAIQEQLSNAYNGVIDGILQTFSPDNEKELFYSIGESFGQATGSTDMLADALTPVVSWLDEIASKIGGD
jgi:hypothetical protein